MGFQYKLFDYFEAFGLHFLMPFAIYFAVILAVIELCIGLCLILNIRTNLAAWAVLVFMSFFTLLTFVLALTNPVSDCGCFGDAIKLTNWQTFFKNLILLPLALLIFHWRKRTSKYVNSVKELCYVVILFAGCFVLSGYCFRHLPLLDFLPYHIGQDLSSAMATPEGAPADQYNVTLIYEKEGTRQEFTAENSPWQDSTWKFIESQSQLITKGYIPLIHDFSITHPQFGDITDSILARNNVLLLVFPKIENCKLEQVDMLRAVAAKAAANGHTVMGLTASLQETAQNFVQQERLNFDFCTTDETALKTTRLYPGLMLLHQSIIVGKWSLRDLPAPDFFDATLLLNAINALREQREKTVCVGALILLLLCCAVFRRQTTKNRR